MVMVDILRKKKSSAICKMKRSVLISNGRESISIPYKVVCDGCGKELISGQYNEYISDMADNTGYQFTSTLELCHDCLNYFIKSDKTGKNVRFNSFNVPKLMAFLPEDREGINLSEILNKE